MVASVCDIQYIIPIDAPDFPPCEKSCRREVQSQFKSELAHFDRGGSSQGHCAKCGGLIVLRLSDPVSYAYDTQCKCRSKPYKYNTDLAMVNADERELLPCDRDSRISFYLEVYLALIPGKILAKCSRVA